jgi:hypothetical protein
MSTPFALPGFMPHRSPLAQAEVLARDDGTWAFDTVIPNTELITQIRKYGQGGKVTVTVSSQAVEQFLDRDKTTLSIVCGINFTEMLADRGDTRIDVTTRTGAVISRVIRQPRDVS